MADDLVAGHAGLCPVVAAFEARVDADPGAAAVVRDGGVVTFGELDAVANGVARELLDRFGGASQPVALMLRNPVRMLAAMLGALKAGKYYVPVNPGHPAARREAVLAQVRARAVLADGVNALESVGVELFDVRGWEPRPRVAWPLLSPASPAYVLFTSGSTGIPKGISHNRTDMWHNVGRHAALRIGPADCVSLISADGFVAAVSNVYIALLNGAALAPYAVYEGGIDELVPWLWRSGVSVCYAFPSFVRQAVAAGCGSAPRVRLVYLGGEPVHPSDVSAARVLGPGATVAVGLNSTETGLARLKLVPPGEPVPSPVPVGGPVGGVEVVVMDGDAVAPPGVTGDIVVRSRCVAPSLVEEGSFVPLSRAVGAEADGVREFRTGDRGRVDADGELVHVGRSDGMVKVRGIRIEIGEVEGALLTLPQVSEAVVVPYEADSLTVELAAHVVPTSHALTTSDVRERLARLLPAASVPSRMWLESSLPRTPNGKVDRRALARLTTSRLAVDADPPAVARESTIPSADPVSSRITELWCETLGLPAATPGSDFFDEGGTSLTALRLVSAARREFDVPLKLAVVFETPTLQALIDAVVALLPVGETASP